MIKENKYNPDIVTHPGKTLSEKLQEMGMSSREFALRTDKPEKTISEILNGNSGITSDMAMKFELITKIPAHFWINLQSNFDEANSRINMEESILSSIDWAMKFPLNEMIKKNWIRKVKSNKEKTIELLKFFNFTSSKGWEKYYLEGRIKTSFRISLANTSDPYSISAWLRKGELQTESTESPIYSEKLFRLKLPEVKNVMAENGNDYYNKVQSICLSAGVKLIYTDSLPNAPINGATRWIGDNPIIQMKYNFSKSENYWLTLFHEIGHILLHGKKDVFLESSLINTNLEKEEKEADSFALNWTQNN